MRGTINVCNTLHKIPILSVDVYEYKTICVIDFLGFQRTLVGWAERPKLLSEMDPPSSSSVNALAHKAFIRSLCVI